MVEVEAGVTGRPEPGSMFSPGPSLWLSLRVMGATVSRLEKKVRGPFSLQGPRGAGCR